LGDPSESFGSILNTIGFRANVGLFMDCRISRVAPRNCGIARFATTWTPHEFRSGLDQQDRAGPRLRNDMDARARLLSPRVITWLWPFVREKPHGYPPFYAIEGMVGDLLAPSSWDTLPRPARTDPGVRPNLRGDPRVRLRGACAWPASILSGTWARSFRNGGCLAFLPASLMRDPSSEVPGA
jgi:hypothetical protein